MARKPGVLKTYPLVSELLKKAVSEKGQVIIAKETGLAQSAVSRYCRGIGEPTQAVLERLEHYFEVPVAVLRGDNISAMAEDFQTFLDTLFLNSKNNVPQNQIKEAQDQLKNSIKKYCSEEDANNLISKTTEMVALRFRELHSDTLLDYLVDIIKKLAASDLIDISAIVERWQDDEEFRSKVKLLLDDYPGD